MWTGSRMLMFAKNGVVVYDPAANDWTNDCCSSGSGGLGATPIWTGTRALLLGSTDKQFGGATFTPPDPRGAG